MLQIPSNCGYVFAIFPNASLLWDSEKAVQGSTVPTVGLPIPAAVGWPNLTSRAILLFCCITLQCHTHTVSRFFNRVSTFTNDEVSIGKTPDVTITLPLSSLSLFLSSSGCSDICSVAQVDTQLPSQELGL